MPNSAQGHLVLGWIAYSLGLGSFSLVLPHEATRNQQALARPTVIMLLM